MKKSLIIDNTEFYYHIKRKEDYFGSNDRTYFYTKTIKQRPKWFLFGKIVEVSKYKFEFDVSLDIEYSSYTQNHVRLFVMRAYNDYKSKKQRQQQINNGEII